MRVLATHSIRQFPLHFPSRASPCATRFRTSSTLDISALCVCVCVCVCVCQGTVEDPSQRGKDHLQEGKEYLYLLRRLTFQEGLSCRTYLSSSRPIYALEDQELN